MNIIKKDGRLEEFSISKIKRSILNASQEALEPLTDSDLKVIESEIMNILKIINREKTSSYEIFAIILNVLKTLEFNNVGKAYLNSSISFYR
nr:ATP cone domain-containing protein [Clostridium chromiireducens]